MFARLNAEKGSLDNCHVIEKAEFDMERQDVDFSKSIMEIRKKQKDQKQISDV